MNCYEQQYSDGFREESPRSVRRQLEDSVQADWRQAGRVVFDSDASINGAAGQQEMQHQELCGMGGYDDMNWGFQSFQSSSYAAPCGGSMRSDGRDGSSASVRVFMPGSKEETGRMRDRSECSLPFNPADFPVGMSYVPMQKWSRPYEMETGFARGTIFPELDLPFLKGRCR